MVVERMLNDMNACAISGKMSVRAYTSKATVAHGLFRLTGTFVSTSTDQDASR